MADIKVAKAIARNAYKEINVSRQQLAEMNVWDAIEKLGFAQAALKDILRELGEEQEGEDKFSKPYQSSLRCYGT